MDRLRPYPSDCMKIIVCRPDNSFKMETTLEEFFKENNFNDSFDGMEEEIRESLAHRGIYHGGGGAFGKWIISKKLG